jgi:hypothetical protein
MQGQETTTMPLKPTRASFIRSLPISMPVEEVIERGREVGLEIQPSDIHAQRYYMRETAGPEAPAKPASPQTTLGVSFTSPASQDKEHRLVKSAATVRVVTGGSAAAAPANQTQASQVNQTVTKPRLKFAPEPSGTLENQLRVLVLRLGIERTRRMIDELEARILGGAS